VTAKTGPRVHFLPCYLLGFTDQVGPALERNWLALDCLQIRVVFELRVDQYSVRPSAHLVDIVDDVDDCRRFSAKGTAALADPDAMSAAR
jgi:hypothetical protein